MASNKEDLNRTKIFTDYATRINRNSVRKLRVIVVTSKLQSYPLDRSVYLLIPEKKKKFEVKLIFDLTDIECLTFSRKSTCLLKIGLKSKDKAGNKLSD